ncbi:MAG TPA: zf-HC2 domain-containing protein, partial [Firmicutes bacterium]|nr:zf-HC2 domain-containing protein [Bacillota bacterium]
MDPSEATCAWTRERLSAFLDGELNATEHAGVFRHLEACEACRREYAGLAAALSGLKAGLTEDMPEDRQVGELPFGEFVGKLAWR